MTIPFLEQRNYSGGFPSAWEGLACYWQVKQGSKRRSDDVNSIFLSFNKRALILSSPAASLGFRWRIVSDTKLSGIGSKEKVAFALVGQKFFTWGSYGIFSPNFFPMLTKKELKAVAIDRADVKTVPSTIILAIWDDGLEERSVSLSREISRNPSHFLNGFELNWYNILILLFWYYEWHGSSSYDISASDNQIYCPLLFLDDSHVS